MFRRKKAKTTEINLEKDKAQLEEFKKETKELDKAAGTVAIAGSALGAGVALVGSLVLYFAGTAAVIATGGGIIGVGLIIGGIWAAINAADVKDFETEVLNKSKKQKQLMIPLTKMNDYFKNIIKERGKETDAFQKTLLDADGKEITYEKKNFRAEGNYIYDETNRQYIFSDGIKGKETYVVVSIREGEILILYDKKTNIPIFKWFNDKDGIPMFYFKDGMIFVCSGEHNQVKRFTFDIETFKAE